MDNKNVQRNLFAALLQNELKSNVEHFTTYVQTCLAANEVAAGCENLLQKLDITFTLCNKIYTCRAFYQPKANLSCRKWRKSGVKLVSVAAVFWMSRNFGGALRDIQKTAARETSVKRDSRVILSNQKSWVLTQFATTWFVARHVSTSVGGEKTSLQQFAKQVLVIRFTEWE